MFFNSYPFLFLFLPLFLVSWQAVALLRPQFLIYVPLFFSLAFYAYWSGPFLFLLLGIIAMNLGLAHLLIWHRQAAPGAIVRQRHILVLGVLLNLLPLIWFKYSFFIIQNLSLLLDLSWRFLPPDLPLGISFYTFIQVAWLISVYHGEEIAGPIPEHIVFSCAFPYVISGPIVRQSQLGWQLGRLRPLTSEGLARGFTLFAMGLFKKVVIADNIGRYADAVFGAATRNWPLSGSEAWLGSFCYTFQLYFDFSGYTDMALGIGLMVGLRLPQNFNSPYKATGIVDFWRRWHITLSSWLRDFLYIPMGGNRRGCLRQYRNLFLTMLIGGAWHGAGWTFIIWGVLHGAMLGINHFFRASIRGTAVEGLLAHAPVRLFFIVFTFFCLNFCWVIFRAPDLNVAAAMYEAMFTGTFTLSNNYFPHWQPFALLALAGALCWGCPNSQEILESDRSMIRWRPTGAWAIAMALAVFISMTMLSRHSTFLYFQF